MLDPVGAITEEDYIAVGTGATTALGVLESGYREDLSLSQARDLAITAMRAAISRDPGSGDGIDLLTITPDGYKEESIRLRVVTS
ncbi:proteasome subunit alpha [compost metagenome]